MNIIELNNQVENFVNKYELSNEVFALKKEYTIQKSEEWQRVLDSFKEEGRTLRIGIIGRVKAGKSSMLNALLFNGNDILPKAATPMTAALTIMEYSETIRAEVDFFSETDIQEIKQKHDAYHELFEKKLKEMEEELTQKEKGKRNRDELNEAQSENKLFKEIFTNNKKENEKDIKEKALKRVEREMKNDPTFASYDQYQRIKATNKSLKDLENFRIIEANSIEALMNGELNQFVGSSGEFMPFTKSVKLYIPEPGLQGLQIIDTPGINDPVTSRGERTEQLLQDCDVVLLVSPAGQFLSSEDTDLIHRVTTKEGTQQAYIIASQIDTQLFGSEKKDFTNPIDVLENLSKNNLTNHAHSVLKAQLAQYSSMKTVMDKLTKHQVICLSSVAFSLLKRFNEEQNWDDNLKTVWSNLKLHFPDTFNQPELAKNALKKLANIEKLHQVIQEVQENKDKILAEKKINFEKDKQKALFDYIDGLTSRINEQINYIENSDINELQKQSKHLNNQKEKLKSKLDDAYDDLILDIKINLDKQLKEQLKNEMQKYNSTSENSQSEESFSQTKLVEKAPWWKFWASDRYETTYHVKLKVQTTPIYRAIQNIRDDLEDKLLDISNSHLKKFKNKIYTIIYSVLEEIMEDEELDIQLIARTGKNVLAQFPEPQFKLVDDIPSNLKCSTVLEKYEAERYISSANEYVMNLNQIIRTEINHYIENLMNNLRQISLSNLLTGQLEKDLNQLLNDIENKQSSLYRYQSMKNELQVLKQG